MTEPKLTLPALCDLHPRALAWALFILTLLIFRLSPVIQFYDSRFTVLLSESLYARHTFDLAPYFPPGPPAPSPSASLPYQIHAYGPHRYYLYPPGTSILSIPAVALLNLLGLQAGKHGVYVSALEGPIQQTLAAVLCAFLSVVFFQTARRLLPALPALAVAFTGALATQVWSTASRALWSHTWAILLLSLAIDQLVRFQTTRQKINPLWLGTLLAWSYFTRPTFFIPAATIALYLLLYDRRRGLLVSAIGLLWMSLFMLWSKNLYGTWLPEYFRSNQGFSFSNFPTAALGHLISPSRGLLIYSPWLLSPTFLLLRHRPAPALRPLTLLALLSIALHFFLISTWPIWWMGFCYGPRATTDIVPWLILLAAISLTPFGTPNTPSATTLATLRQRPLFLSVATTLLAISLAMHAIGACSHAANAWNSQPQNIDLHPTRLWDWTDPPFLRFLHST